MNTKQVGDETEAKVLARLIAAGYSVSIPFGDNDRYDLLVDTDESVLKVQCKTGWIEGDVVRFKTASKTTRNGTTTTIDYEGEIDAFAVYCAETDGYYWVPEAEAGSKSSYLRLGEPDIDHPRVKRAPEYAFSKRLP